MSSKTDRPTDPGTAFGPRPEVLGGGTGRRDPGSASGWAGTVRPRRRAAFANASRRAGWPGSSRKELEAAQETIAQELAAAQEVIANLPQAIADARRSKRRPRPLVLAAAGVAVLAVGAVAFSIIRRSMQPEPSPLPPSVEVTPKP